MSTSIQNEFKFPRQALRRVGLVAVVAMLAWQVHASESTQPAPGGTAVAPRIAVSDAGQPVAVGSSQAMFAEMSKKLAMSKMQGDKPVGPTDFMPSECWQDGAGLNGLDPISYFAGSPQLGQSSLVAEHLGVKYQFSNVQNRRQFLAAPDRFAPRYGGYCAIALAHGSLRCATAENYLVDNGNLYLFKKTAFTNGRVVWTQEADRYKALADENYAGIAAPASVADETSSAR